MFNVRSPSLFDRSKYTIQGEPGVSPIAITFITSSTVKLTMKNHSAPLVSSRDLTAAHAIAYDLPSPWSRHATNVPNCTQAGGAGCGGAGGTGGR